jgi:type IV pilus assembly protein PilW
MKKNQLGLTILELLISLTVGLFLFAGVLSIFIGMRTTTEETTSYGALQENARFALNIISEDLQRQAFWGDYTGDIDLASLIETVDPATIGGDCVGGGVNNASFPVAVGAFRTLWGVTVTAANNMNCITDARIGSDIIQIKRAVANPLDVGDIQANRYYIRSSANAAAIFAGNGAVPVINHSRIWEYQHHVYYVREEQVGTETVPVLVQGTLSNTASVMNMGMLVEGIEMIKFMYGVDMDGDGIVDSFVSADDMLDNLWDQAGNINILSVKVFVLARDIRPDQKYENKNVYQLGDSTVDFSGNSDNYRRLLMSSTVSLDNARTISWP